MYATQRNKNKKTKNIQQTKIVTIRELPFFPLRAHQTPQLHVELVVLSVDKSSHLSAIFEFRLSYFYAAVLNILSFLSMKIGSFHRTSTSNISPNPVIHVSARGIVLPRRNPSTLVMPSLQRRHSRRSKSSLCLAKSLCIKIEVPHLYCNRTEKSPTIVPKTNIRRCCY